MLLLPREALAIPAFAREYGVPCQTCHVVIGRRNEFGDVFRKWGFHWPGSVDRDRSARRDPPVGLEGIALWPSFLPSKIPLAVAASMAGSYTTDPNADPALTFSNPSLRILLGGSIGNHLGFFGTWTGGSNPPDELYLHVTRVFDRPEINFMFGRLEQTTTLFKGNEAIVSRYLLSSAGINGHAVSTGRLGAEYNGVFFGRTFLAAGAVQNAGIGSSVDLYYHVSQRLGGMDLLGHEPDIDLEAPSLLDDFVVSLGHWGYRGHVRGADGEDAYLIRRFGLDLQVRFLELNLWAGAMLGLDGDIAALRPVRNLTWFGELSYEVFSWLMLAYLYQYQDRTQAATETQLHDFAILFLPFENVRVRVKFAFSDDGEKNEVGEAQLLVGL